MRRTACLFAAVLSAAGGCSRSAEETRPHQAAAASPRDVSVPRVEGTAHGVEAGSPRTLRAEIRPVTLFRIVPVGEAAVAPARATLGPLRARYVGYGFELGALQPAPVARGADCAELIRRQLGARGTLFVVAGSVACATPFGTLDPELATALVSLGTLGPPGADSDRRLTALLGSMVGELIGLSMPCTDGLGCCALRRAKDLRTLDAQAAAPCPSHAAELDRIREGAGMQ